MTSDYERGAEAMREACATVCRDEAKRLEGDVTAYHLIGLALALGGRIRALPLPAPQPAGAVEKAREATLHDAAAEELPLHREIENAINGHGVESGSNTPDFVLAAFLMDCLRAFDAATNQREKWYGRTYGDNRRAAEQAEREEGGSDAE